MKFIVLLAVVLVVLWIMRSGRPRRGSDVQRPPAPPQQDMVECPVCHVHLPRADALAGPKGQLYCCVEHRQNAGG